MGATGGGAAVVFVLFVGVVYLACFIGLVALGTLVARRVWRWDERRDSRRGGS
ncbi:MAG TPA: hypothetical protein VFO83_11170 [Aggregicoccus sp.]|nr:hypothetical protein [Aggregicoccus sp.]